MAISVKVSDLEDGLIWVSADVPCINAAYVDRQTGQVHLDSDFADYEEDRPQLDFDDASIYLAIPHKKELDLGRGLVFRFIDEVMPESSDTIRQIFSKKGAYGRFRDFLERTGQLDAWYAYEAKATGMALREWAEAHDLLVA